MSQNVMFATLPDQLYFFHAFSILAWVWHFIFLCIELKTEIATISQKNQKNVFAVLATSCQHVNILYNIFLHGHVHVYFVCNSFSLTFMFYKKVYGNIKT